VAGKRRPLSHHFIFALLGAALIALSARLFMFQKTCQGQMARLAQGQQEMRVDVPGRRGGIYASSHAERVQLAASRQIESCFADPMIIADGELRPVSVKLAAVLGVPAGTIHSQLTSRRRSRFVRLARQVDADTAARIRKLSLRGIGITREWQRYYPNGALAAHVVGFSSKGPRGRECGLEGMELYADAELRSTDGRWSVLTDAARRPIWREPGTYVPPGDGQHVTLTIDVVIQGYLEETLAKTKSAFAAESVVGVIVDPKTGDILAMSSAPTYELNTAGLSTLDQRRNRVIVDPYEPGSIFKPFIASMALAMGKVRMGEKIFCHNGAYRCRSRRLLHDAHGYGDLIFEQIVYKSSNIGMAIIGERLGNAALLQIVRAFGFGTRTGVELKGEDPGLVHPAAAWNSYSTTSVPMGQEVSVTALQMAMGFSVFANGGVLLRPRLIRSIHSADGKLVRESFGPDPVRRVLPEALCRQFVDEVLALVPTKGTGRRHARLDGWSSLGKTGTAQISPYSAGKFTASYIAAAPVGEPRLVCLISVRKPSRVSHYGGTVAGPAVKEVLEKSLAYLGVPRDAVE